MIRVRKLTPAEAGQLCECGLKPAEWGHKRGCPHFLAKRTAYRTRQSRRWRAKQRQQRLDIME